MYKKIYAQLRDCSILVIQACNEILSNEENHKNKRGQTAATNGLTEQSLIIDVSVVVTE